MMMLTMEMDMTLIPAVLEIVSDVSKSKILEHFIFSFVGCNRRNPYGKFLRL